LLSKAIYVSEQVCIGWCRTGAYFTAKLTFFHDLSIQVWGAYYTSVYIIFELLQYLPPIQAVPAVTRKLQSISAHWLVFISRVAEEKRLSSPEHTVGCYVVSRLFRNRLKDTINDISDSSERKKGCLSEALLLAPKCDDVTSKEGKFRKDVFFQFISETQVKL